LGAKKVVGEEIDFEEAEKRAKEEAERIEKLGYDPEADKVEAVTRVKSPTASEKPTIAAPTPISPPKAGYGAQTGHQRSPSEIERLGMGMGRLGFGQIGSTKPVASAEPRKLGFGSVGTPKATEGWSMHLQFLRGTES
jgi:ADP-ribosylation factor GTPase-activating protein 2/3